jgi:hypothetical protein
MHAAVSIASTPVRHFQLDSIFALSSAAADIHLSDTASGGWVK